MVVYECMHCEYKFDSEKGDPAYNIAPETLLEELPDDCACPGWGAGKKVCIWLPTSLIICKLNI